MAIDMFETRTMLRALEQMSPVQTFLLDTFFPSSQIVASKYVDIDIYKKGRLLAPFQSNELAAKTIDKTGYETKTYTPPVIKIKAICTAYDTFKRDPGDTIYDQGMSPLGKAQQMLGKQLQEMIDMIRRREEWMAANLLDTGSYAVVGDGVNFTIDFELPATHRYTVATVWTNTSADPLSDLRDAADLIQQDSGMRPNVLVMGKDVIKPFLDRVGSKLDILRMEMATIRPERLPSGAQYWGRLLDSGLDVYSYSEFYQDEAGTMYNLMPADRVFLGNTMAYTGRYYGMIQDLDLAANVQFYPKTWTQPDPSAMFLSVQSRPLVAMHQVDAFASIEVV